MLRSNFLSEIRKTIGLAIPVIIGNIGQTLISVTDNIMVGKLGANALGATGFSGGIFYVFFLFGVGTLAPLAALFAQSHGRDQHHEGGDLLRHSVLAAIIISGLLMLLLWKGRPLLYQMGQDPSVVDLSIDFITYLIVSLFPALLFQAYKQFTDGIGKTQIGMYVMLVAIVTNIAGNIIFINGLFGFPTMGLNGSGLATLLSRILTAILMMIYVHKHPQFQKYFAERWWRAVEKGQLQKIFRLGIPNGLTYIFEVGAFTFSSIMMGWLGAAALAAHQIALNIATISFLVTVGIGTAGSIRVAFEISQGRCNGAHLAGRVAILLGTSYMLFSTLLVFSFREKLAQIYTTDPEVIHFTILFLGVAAAFQFFDGIQAVAVGVLRGMQDTKLPSILAFIAYWLIGLPLGYSLAFKVDWKGLGIWWGLFTALAFMAISLTLRFEKLITKKPDQFS